MNSLLHKKVENRFGRPIKFSYECVELSAHIKKSINTNISPQTLRRVMGFIKDNVKTSNRILDYISIYCGYDNYETLLLNKENKNQQIDESIVDTIKLFYNIEINKSYDINYQRASGNIAKLIVTNSALFNKLSGFLAKKEASQIYFFERYPYIDGLNESYLSHLQKYMQNKKTKESDLFGYTLHFLSHYLRENFDELPKYIKKINEIDNTNEIHPFPIARKLMSNIVFAHYNNDQYAINEWTKVVFSEEKNINKKYKSNNVFPFYHYIIADYFNLIGEYESALKVYKIAELDYKSYNDGSIEFGYYENFDLMKAITYYNTGDKQAAKRILKRIDSSMVQFTFQDYHNINRKILEYNLTGPLTSRKKELLKEEINLLIDKTGYTLFRKFIKE